MKNKTVKVSVIIPVYNVESYIVQCLNSLINQTLREIEILLIDDFSTDRSGIICDKYAAKDERIIVIHNEENIRQGPSRNKGIEIARGEYMGFVDPDDWVDLDFFEKLYLSAEENNSDIVKTERIDVSPNGNRVKQGGLNKKITDGLKKGLPVFLLFTYEHWTAIFKRELVIKNGARYPDLRNAQDLVFLLNVTYFSTTISLISGTHYFYRQHPYSIISIKEKPYFESTLQYFKMHLDFINTHEMERNFYDLAFSRGLLAVTHRYNEINFEKGAATYKTEYVREALSIVSHYKYDAGHLLESLFNGFTYDKQIETLKRGNAFRIGKAITWLPSKIKSLLK